MPTMTQAGYKPPKPEPKREPTAPQKKKKKKKGRKRLNAAAIISMVIFAAAVFVGAATIYIYTQTQPYAQAYCPGTSLDNYPLAGATQDDALELLRRTTAENVSNWRFEMSWQGKTYAVTAEDVGLAVDEQATLQPLWLAGREGGMFSRYLQMLKLRREPMNAKPQLLYEMEPVDNVLEQIRADIECEPVDAAVTFAPGSSTPFHYSDEAPGYQMDVSPLRAQIEQAIRSLTCVQMELVAREIAPAVTRAALERASVLRTRLTMKIAADEASYTNAAAALDMLDGVRIDAGEDFSFNAGVGRRAEEAGYVFAPEPAYGEDVAGVGGGVCQASTALYRAALLGGLSVVQRSAAVRPVSYCDMGQEATVSDQGLDMVIGNTTEATLFIRARAYRSGESAYAQIDLIGAPMENRYTLESHVESLGMITEPVYVRDSEGTYARFSDERVAAGEAVEGFHAVVERLTLDSEGNELAREVVSDNTYEAIPPMIYVGIEER